jgi:hypothetical protein
LSIAPREIGYRSAFIGAVLKTLSNVGCQWCTAAEPCHQVVAAASLCCCGLTPRTRLNAVLSANGLP